MLEMGIAAMAEEERIYTTKEVAAILRVHILTVRRMIQRGDLEAFAIGDEYRITQSALDAVKSTRKMKVVRLNQEGDIEQK